MQDLPIDFPTFLERHAELLRALPAWKVQLLVPVHKMDATSLYKAAFQEHPPRRCARDARGFAVGTFRRAAASRRRTRALRSGGPRIRCGSISGALSRVVRRWRASVRRDVVGHAR